MVSQLAKLSEIMGSYQATVLADKNKYDLIVSWYETVD